jgi:hypothetical protein
MTAKGAAGVAAAIGTVVPLLILFASHVITHAWWPTWIRVVWPSSYVLIATSGIDSTNAYKIVTASIVLNACLYLVVGLVVFWTAKKVPS